MTPISTEVATEQLLTILREAFEGAPGKGSWFTDSGPEAGLLGTIGKLSAAEASRPLGGSTIAAHVHHVVFALGVSSAWIRGERKSWDWDESWSVSRVNDAEWAGMIDELRAAYGALQRAIEAGAASSPDAMAGAIAAVAHSAAHLGAIRQKIRFAETG